MELTTGGKNLRSVLEAVLSDSAGLDTTDALVSRVDEIAFASINRKARRGKLPTRRFGIALKDLTRDCTAELYQRDDAGHFVRIRAYFRDVDLSKVSDDELTVMFRRLICSNVRENLFRLYGEFDPGLSRIIRGLKLAIKSHDELYLEQRRSEQWIRRCIGNSSPEAENGLSEDILESRVLSILHGKADLRQVVDALASFMQDHSLQSLPRPLNGLAQDVREAMFREWSAEECGMDERVLRLDDLARLITRAVNLERPCFYASYVEAGKIPLETFELYCSAVQEILQGQYVHGSYRKISFYKALRTYMPDLTEISYRRDHRNVLEYLVKRTRKKFFRLWYDEEFVRPFR